MKTLIPYITVSILLTLFACSPKYYVPNTQNVPLLSSKGQTNLSVAGTGNQFELQGAHAISNNVGVMVNGAYFRDSGEEDQNGKGSGVLGEAGLGYFTPVGENFIFETYGILGVGSVENSFSLTEGTSNIGTLNASIFKAGIQPNFGFSSNFFSIAISSRIAVLNYSNIEGNLIFDGENQAEYLNNNKSNVLLEPALTIRAGLERAKLQLQFCCSFNLSNKDFLQEKSVVTLGVNFNIF